MSYIASQSYYTSPPGPPPGYHVAQPQQAYGYGYGYGSGHGQWGYQTPNPPLPARPSGHSPRHSHGGPLSSSASSSSYSSPGYHPRVGLTNLGSRFHVWNTMSNGGTSYLEMGSQPHGPVAYSAKVGSDKFKIKPGPYRVAKESKAAVCVLEGKSTFSSKTLIRFDHFQAVLTETTRLGPGAVWAFEVQANGRTERWEWRRRKEQKPSLLRSLVTDSSKKFGSWDLVRSGAPPGEQPVATWSAQQGATTFESSDLGVFEFHGPAAQGALGDAVHNMAIAVLLRIMSQHYMIKVANMVASAV